MLVKEKFKNVEETLNQNPFIRAQRVNVKWEDGKVRLEGEVRSFFEKQMAQEAIKQLDAFEEIENAIEVYDRT